MNEYDSIYKENAAPVQATVTVAEKPPVVFTRSERITAIVMLLAGFLWVRLCLYHESGLFTSLLYIAIITVQAVFFRKNGVVFTKSEKLTLGVMYAFSLVYTLTANDLLKGLNTIFLMMLGCLLLFHTANPDGDILRFLPVSSAYSMVAAPLHKCNAAALAVTSGAKKSGFWKNTGYILLGLLLAVPVTVIAGALLYSADDNMANLIDRLGKLPSDEILVLIPHLLFGFLLGSMMFSAVYSAHQKALRIVPEECNNIARNCRIVPNPMVYAMVTPLCILYLLFFFSQLQYFLGGFTGDVTGFTYAEYARRGFFELCGVCCLNLIVIGGMGFFSKLTGTEKPLALKLFASFLCISSLLLSGTAIAKMFLYIRVYGMTQLRVYTTWFMFLLVVLFGLLLVKQFKATLNIGKIGAVTFTVLFALLCFSRPDAWMTRYNAELYLSGQLEEFDSEVLYEMSDDAWSALTAYDSETIDRLLNADTKRTFALYTTPSEHPDFWDVLNLSAWELMAYET